MKKVFCLMLVLLLALTLAACGCKHETWKEADCVTPKTCAECGETEGAPLGHSWLAATCETPKTCENCGETEGEAPGHTWTDATCAAPKTCTSCGLTEGSVLEHTWVEATTEAPKTCTGCGLTDGERIVTDARFTTAATKDFHGTWVCRLDMDGELMELEDFEGTLPVNLVMKMHNDGTLTMHIEVADQEAFYQAMKDYMMDLMYAELANGGMNKEEADQAMKDTYGMTTEEYVDHALGQLDFNSLFATFNFNMVYYVEGDQLYTGTNWNAEMTTNAISLEGDALTIVNMGAEMGYNEGDLVFTRVTE